MKRAFASLALACAVLLLGASMVAAQGNTVQLSLSKTMGFSLGSQIQGLFNLSVSGTSDISSVTYQLDGKDMATVTQSPFQYSFSTDVYPTGQHTLSAIVRTSSGQTLQSSVIPVEMVTPSAGWQTTATRVWPIILILLLVIVIAMAVQYLPIGGSKRRYQPGQARNYGLIGGAICSRCHRPFPLSFFSARLVVGRLERCPYCGKWQLARAATLDALHAAEQGEIEGAKPNIQESSPEERLKQQIEESRLSR